MSTSKKISFSSRSGFEEFFGYTATELTNWYLWTLEFVNANNKFRFNNEFSSNNSYSLHDWCVDISAAKFFTIKF